MVSEKVSVVLVDDSTDVRTLVRMRLESSGHFDVLGEAADGDQAIGLVVRHRPDLVLLDVSMPAMDGLETLPAILAVRPDTAVVMFSGFGGADLTAELEQLGARGHIEKSIPLEQLPERLLQSLRAPRGAVLQPEHEAAPPGDGLPLDEVDVARLEQAILDEHVEGFRALFDRAAIGMATLTVHATIVRANAALAELMSCTPSDLVGVDYGRLTGGKGDVLDDRLEAMRSSDLNVATFEHRLPAAPGATAVRTAMVTLVPIRDAVGELLYVFAQVQDISAQRRAEVELFRSEENFRLVVAAVEDYAIFMLDPDGTVVSWNAGARRIKGYEAAQIVGRHFRVFYAEEDQATGVPERNLEVATRDGSFTEEGWRVRQDGSRFWALVVISAVHDDEGRHIGFAKITRDQTDAHKSVEDRLEVAANQAKLLAVTAHELRNPTAVIDGSAHLLETSHEDMSDHERRQFFRGIHTSTERLRRLTADLTAAAQLQGPGISYDTGSVSLADLVRSAVARRESADQGVHIEVDVPVVTVIEGDEVRLAQGIDNLLDNAVRHGAPPIAVAARVRDDVVEVRVCDGGPGVPLDLVPRLFDRHATSGAAGGSGLGLYLVREIVRGHGGEVDYQPPAPGSPTTFVVRLPVDVADGGAASQGV